MTYTSSEWETYWALNKDRINERRRKKYRENKRTRDAALRRSAEQVLRKRKAREEAHGE